MNSLAVHSAPSNLNGSRVLFFIVPCILCLAFILFPEIANAQGLEKGVDILTTLKTQIYNIVSVLAAIIIIVIGISYAAKWATLETCMRWGVGCLIVACGSQLVGLIFGTST